MPAVEALAVEMSLHQLGLLANVYNLSTWKAGEGGLP